MVTARAVREMCQAFLSEGRLDNHLADLLSFQELKDLLGVEEYLASQREIDRLIPRPAGQGKLREH